MQVEFLLDGFDDGCLLARMHTLARDARRNRAALALQTSAEAAAETAPQAPVRRLRPCCRARRRRPPRSEARQRPYPPGRATTRSSLGRARSQFQSRDVRTRQPEISPVAHSYAFCRARGFYTTRMRVGRVGTALPLLIRFRMRVVQSAGWLPIFVGNICFVSFSWSREAFNLIFLGNAHFATFPSITLMAKARANAHKILRLALRFLQDGHIKLTDFGLSAFGLAEVTQAHCTRLSHTYEIGGRTRETYAPGRPMHQEDLCRNGGADARPVAYAPVDRHTHATDHTDRLSQYARARARART
eukprot:6192329-Pleurochrysis_carterae.AAC.2